MVARGAMKCGAGAQGKRWPHRRRIARCPSGMGNESIISRRERDRNDVSKSTIWMHQIFRFDHRKLGPASVPLEQGYRAVAGLPELGGRVRTSIRMDVGELRGA